MDSDDISDPTRIQHQIQYMDTHPEIVLCGTRARFIDAEGQLLAKRELKVNSSWAIRFWMPLFNMLYHPSFCIRASVLRDNNLAYDQNYRYSQDYAFGLQMLQYGELANVPELLLSYRIT